MKAIVVIGVHDYIVAKGLLVGNIQMLNEDGTLYDTLYAIEPQPLKPLPKHKDNIGTEYIDNAYAIGWNACLDEILGEEDV